MPVHSTACSPYIHPHEHRPAHRLPPLPLQEKFYTIGEQLGKGSFAVVKKGTRKSDGQVCAVKYATHTPFPSR